MLSASTRAAQELMLHLHGQYFFAIGAAAKFGYADHLASGAKTADELARLTDTHGPTVYRLLRALGDIGIFEEREGHFANTPQSELLRADHPTSLRPAALFLCHESIVTTWANLDYSVKTGKPAFDHVYGTGFWHHMKEHPDVGPLFNATMASYTSSQIEAVLDAYDFSGIQRLCDVGGGQGRMLAAILAKYPKMRGILFDQPHVIGGAAPTLERAGVSARCEQIGGSFFESVPAEADAHLLKAIIHDWNDEDCLRILEAVNRASKPGQKLLVIDAVVQTNRAPGNTLDLNKMVDLVMLLFTSGGRERTERDFAALLGASNFELVRVLPTQSPISIIEARAK
ncbi:SAM-dependent methyltransferase [Pendulispora brunnea]|uniref:SAM-dependent methyltransferase n=1 Tax=Pendulispora brunnea TaxID=2905690 RepID=A0ABZ2KAL4_9BACT